MARIMKDSQKAWIGQIPDNWEVRKVKNYYTIQTGFTPDTKTEDYYDSIDGEDWVNISDIQDGNTITRTKNKISKLYVEQYRPEPIPKGSLMYSFKLSVGQVAFAGKDIYSNEAIAAFLPKDNINLKFLRYSSSLIIENAETNIYNAKILNQERIKNAYIVFPPLDEQKKIADFLDQKCSTIDCVIEKTKASIEEYKKFKQAVITQAVTKGVQGDRPMKDSGIKWIGKIPEEWSVSRVGLHFDITLGKMLCSEQPSEDYTLEPYYCALNIHFDGIDYCTIKEMWFSNKEKEIYKTQQGDLLVVEGGAGAGGASIIDEKPDRDYYIQNSVMIVRSKNAQDAYRNRYLRYLLECIVKKGYVDVVCNKATIPHFTKDKLSCVPFLITKEYKEIVEYVEKKCKAIDLLIEKKEKCLFEIEQYKKSLIFEYVTGKKEIK